MKRTVRIGLRCYHLSKSAMSDEDELDDDVLISLLNKACALLEHVYHKAGGITDLSVLLKHGVAEQERRDAEDRCAAAAIQIEAMKELHRKERAEVVARAAERKAAAAQRAAEDRAARERVARDEEEEKRRMEDKAAEDALRVHLAYKERLRERAAAEEAERCSTEARLQAERQAAEERARAEREEAQRIAAEKAAEAARKVEAEATRAAAKAAKKAADQERATYAAAQKAAVEAAIAREKAERKRLSKEEKKKRAGNASTSIAPSHAPTEVAETPSVPLVTARTSASADDLRAEPRTESQRPQRSASPRGSPHKPLSPASTISSGRLERSHLRTSSKATCAPQSPKLSVESVLDNDHKGELRRVSYAIFSETHLPHISKSTFDTSMGSSLTSHGSAGIASSDHLSGVGITMADIVEQCKVIMPEASAELDDLLSRFNSYSLPKKQFNLHLRDVMGKEKLREALAAVVPTKVLDQDEQLRTAIRREDSAGPS